MDNHTTDRFCVLFSLVSKYKATREVTNEKNRETLIIAIKSEKIYITTKKH